jgi:hypothetical protein
MHTLVSRNSYLDCLMMNPVVNSGMRRLLPFLILSFICLTLRAQTIVANGEQPRITSDSQETIRLVYGEKDKIYCLTSTDRGVTFSKPVQLGEVTGMHLGMTRGPQLATSKNQSLVTAIDKQGNIHSYVLDHRSGQWNKIQNVNDVTGSAPEGLMSIAADDNNNFYAVWLDLRNEHNNNICYSALRQGKWMTNKFIYVSPDAHVCECCKPSIAVNNKVVSIMFRNWLKGSRDLYLSVSPDGGNSFQHAQKLGTGTWVLNGCPMDGGGLSIDADNAIHTAWQRDGIVYHAQPGGPEQRIADGRHVTLSGDLLMWQQGSDLYVMAQPGNAVKVAEGTAPDAVTLKDHSLVVVWENDHKVISRAITPKEMDALQRASKASLNE